MVVVVVVVVDVVVLVVVVVSVVVVVVELVVGAAIVVKLRCDRLNLDIQLSCGCSTCSKYDDFNSSFVTKTRFRWRCRKSAPSLIVVSPPPKPEADSVASDILLSFSLWITYFQLELEEKPTPQQNRQS